jgi:hypothetical protein
MCLKRNYKFALTKEENKALLRFIFLTNQAAAKRRETNPKMSAKLEQTWANQWILNERDFRPQ